MAYPSSAFRVRDVAPDDLAWHTADEPERRSFWREVVQITLRVKDDSLARGLDRHGLKMKRVSRWTRKHRRSAMGAADPSAPPLQPAHAASRTRAYLKGRAFADHAEFYWTNGWGKILRFHAAGARNRWAKSGRLPVRDVIGLSQADTNEVRREARAWWRARHRPTVKPRTPSATPAPARTPLAAAGYRFVPAYQSRNNREVTVWADVGRLESLWLADRGYHIPPGGGEDKMKYRNVVTFLGRAKATDIGVEMSRVAVGRDGSVSFIDGRHRFAVLRDQGLTRVPVKVDRADARRARVLFGSPAPAPAAARPPLVLPKPAPDLVFPKATPRKRPALARRAGLMVRRSLDWLKGLFARNPRGS